MEGGSRLIQDVLTRRDGESDLDYHKRLVYGKVIDKTIDSDYSELAEFIYGREYSSDVARRMVYGSCKTLQLLDKCDVEGQGSMSVADGIADQIITLKKERQKFFDQRREYNKLINTDGRMEHLFKTLADAANNLSDTIGDIYVDKRGVLEDPGFTTDNEAVLVFSDWHYGLVADNVFNRFNTEICKQRVMETVDKAARRIMNHGCTKLHIVVLGDLWHGAIHTSVRVASEELVCDQMMQVSEILAQTIEQLSTYVEETIVYVTYGNHARTVQNKKDSTHRDNMERIVPWWLEQRLQKHDNIIIAEESENEFLFINACGHDICASHGDLDSVKTSPRLLATLFHKKYGKNIEYIILGDKHHNESFEELGINAVICGSLCGTDDYANDKRLFSSPSQLLLIVNPECGVDAEYRMKL